ncbi:hypothetical protein CTA1_8308 [Colletotrichum tanaceti]|uniref:Rhodopsin domain-containing protein n=1 Tax=Colletotrichum tanaceti TaxID=1306861 RepID=A0A4U6X5R4_9PEZI|nr:hypothetical protein CTA1_8308 [Colletotrichum tanaceti]
MCHDDLLAGYVQTCVQASCTVREMLVARNQSLAACGVPVSEQDGTVRWFRPTIFVLPTFFLVVRAVNKFMKLSSWGWDDTTIAIAYAVLAAFLPAAYIAEKTGAGRDIWTLTPEQITEFLFVFLIFGTLYMACLAFIKSSILFFYLRIFPDERFRWVLWGTQLFNLLILITFVTGSFAACQPLNFFWNGWKREMTGKCINLNAFAMCHGALNVALDAWMLVLPATQIYGLRMKLKTKIGVMLMFGVGVFLTAVSAYRINALLLFATSYNVTGDSFQGSVWSLTELCVGVFVACLPSARQVWRITFPKILEVTHLSTKAAPSSKGSNNISQASSGAQERPRMISYEESSIAHLVGDFNKFNFNDLADLSPTEDKLPRTPKNRTETKAEPGSGSSKGS